jgi:molybdate transport system regulatory protein
MRTWFISGGRSGVGKTYIAKQLCAVLPSSVYAKCGCGTPKRGKSPNLFANQEDLHAFIETCRGSYANAVIETNTFRNKRDGDITVFLEPRFTTTDVRKDADQLRRSADICVPPREEKEPNWRRVLEGILDDRELIDTLVDILAEQRRRLRSTALGVRSKIWFVNAEDEHIFGSGLAQLLVEVEHLGSLEAAAERLKMSGEGAREAIQTAEEYFGWQLILQTTGGDERVESKLTKTGKRVVALYLRLSEKAAEFVDSEFADALADGLSGIEESS